MRGSLAILLGAWLLLFAGSAGAGDGADDEARREGLGALRAASRAREHARAVQLGRDLLPRLEGERHRSMRVEAHGHVASALRSLGQLPEAEVHARAAFAEAQGDRLRRDTLRHLVTILVQSGQVHEASRRTEALRVLQERLANPRGVAACDVQLASMDASLGRWASAVARIERALAFFEREGAPFERRAAHMHAARIAVEMLDAGRAHRHVARARDAGRGLELDPVPLLQAEAAAFALEGRHAESATVFERALTLAAGRPAANRAALLLGYATVLAMDGRAADAVAALAKARGLAEGSPDRMLEARLLATESRVHLARGDTRAAVAAASKARRLCDELLLYQLASVIETRLADAWLAQGDASKAGVHAERAIELILRRSAALPERLGAQYRAELRGVFALAAEAAARRDDAAALFRAAERARAVSLRHRLGGSATYLAALDAGQQAREAALEEAETRAVARYRSAVRSGVTASIRTAFDELGTVRERLDRHREQVQAANAAAAQILDPQVVELAVIQARLEADEVQVHFVHGARTILALVVAGSDTPARIVRLESRAALEAMLAEIALEDDTAPATSSLARLRAALVEPLDVAPRVRRVTFVPTGQLAGVPFGALLPEKDVTLTPSATVDQLLRLGQTGAATGILAVGDPASEDGARLPGAAVEAAAVGDVHLVGADATEPRLRALLARETRWRAVHLACHGLIDPVHPLRSSLALAPSATEDGLWTVSEILASKVPSDLVVLAACSTAQARTFEQEGRIGFVHAFFVAGATRVLASLWDVDDEATHALMLHLYEALDRGVAPDRALREAQAQVRARPRFAHPAFWAGWQLWGPSR